MRKGGRCHICMILLAVLFVSTACGTVSDESANPQQSNMEYAPAKSQQLSGEDLAYFNETLFNKGDKTGLQNLFLTQAYNHPKELNLFYLFANGLLPSDEMSERERQRAFAESQLTIDEDYSLRKITAATMEQILMQYTGLTVSEINPEGLNRFIFLTEYDAYYYFVDDSFIYTIPAVTFVAGEQVGNTVYLYYDATDVYLDGDQPALCATIEKTQNGYLVSSNQFVPIPMYLETTPEFAIPLTGLVPYTTKQLSVLQHSHDVSYCYAKKNLGTNTVCVYESTDGNQYVAFLYDESNWNTGVFLTLPTKAYNVGFSFAGLNNLLGEPGLEISYVKDGQSTWEYYIVSNAGIPSRITKERQGARVIDLDKDGWTEVIACSNSHPQVLFRRGENLYRIDLESLIKETIKGVETMSFEMPDENTLSFDLALTKENSTAEQAAKYLVYFYHDLLLIYDS